MDNIHALGNIKYIFKDKMIGNISTDLALNNAIRGVEYTDNGYHINNNKIFSLPGETQFNLKALDGIKGVRYITVTGSDIVLGLRIESSDPIKIETFQLKIESDAFNLNLKKENSVVNADNLSGESNEAAIGRCYYSLEAISPIEYLCNVTFNYYDIDNFKLNVEKFKEGIYTEIIELEVFADVVKKVESIEQVGNVTDKETVLVLDKNPLFHNLNGTATLNLEENDMHRNKIYNKITCVGNLFTREMWVTAKEPLDETIIVKISHSRIGSGAVVDELIIGAGTTCSAVLKGCGLMYRHIVGIYKREKEVENNKDIYYAGDRIDYTGKYVFDKKHLYRKVYVIEPQIKDLSTRLIAEYASGRQSLRLTLAIENAYDIYRVGDKVYAMNCRKSDYDIAVIDHIGVDTESAVERMKFIDKNSFIRNIHGKAKKFIVTSAEITYNGAYRQNLDLLEVK